MGVQDKVLETGVLLGVFNLTPVGGIHRSSQLEQCLLESLAVIGTTFNGV